MAEREAPPGATDESSVKWLALLLRQVALMLASAVELRYGLKRRTLDN